MQKKISNQSIQQLFGVKQIYTSIDLQKHFGCSHQCIWNNFRNVGYYSSYTHNSKYYTLAAIPEFDEHGIWFYDDPALGQIGFTKFKTASGLIVALINSSAAGLTEDSIHELMKIRISNQLNTLTKTSKIQKLTVDHTRYYLSIDKNTYKQQYANLAKVKNLPIEIKSGSLSNEQRYKHRIRRLIASREQWHTRSKEKQKIIREQLIRIRDLERSRDKWKSLAKSFKNKLKQLAAELEALKKKC